MKVSRRVWTAIVSILFALLVVNSSQSQPSPRTFGNQYGPARFDVPGFMVDLAECPGDSTEPARDLFVAHVETRIAGTGDFQLAGDVLQDGQPTGGILGLSSTGSERISFAFKPPASGLWEVRVSILDTGGRRSCYSDTLVAAWSLSERPGVPILTWDQ